MSELADGLGHGRSHAVIIGVDHYEYAGLPDLPGARAATERLAAALADVSSPWSPVDIRQQLNPTRAELVRAVAEACDDASERLIVYFAGHAVTSRDGELVLAGRDCDPRHPELTGVTWQSLTRELAHAAAPSLLVLLDACGVDSDGESAWQVKSHAAPPPSESRHRTRSWGTSVAALRVSWPYQPGSLSTAVSAVLTSGEGSQPLDDVGALVDRAGAGLADQPRPVRLPDTPRAPGAPIVFLSYRMADEAAAYAATMMDEAVAARYGPRAVFRAREFLPPETSLPESHLAAASQAQVVLVLVGEGWERETDPHVVAELNAAARFQVPIVPVLVGNRGPLRADDLPEGLRHLALSQYLHLPRNLDREQIAALIDRLLTASETQVQSPAERTERLLGADRPDTLTARANLADSYRRAGRTNDAITLLEQVVADSERLLGADHPDTLTARADLADSYRRAGRTNDAITLLEQVVADSERLLGADHPYTVAVKNDSRKWKARL